jgi:hypothetical protein
VAGIEDLVNKGFILGNRSAGKGRSFIVTGQYRSGTSLVAALLQLAGLFIGDDINDIVYQDEEFFRALAAGDVRALLSLIKARNASHKTWGFKYPMLWRAMTAKQLALFDSPRVIITFRDPVSIAVRTSLSEYQDPMHALRDSVTELAALVSFIGDLNCPYLLLSYEKALTFPDDFIDALLQFCDMPSDTALHSRLRGAIELNRTRYLLSARRRFDGLIEGVKSGHLYGWCALTRAPEPVTLEVLVDDRLVAHVIANVFRQDLLDAGVGEGRHGYFVPLDALGVQPNSVIRVRVAQHGVELNNSGRRLRELAVSA